MERINQLTAEIERFYAEPGPLNPQLDREAILEALQPFDFAEARPAQDVFETVSQLVRTGTVHITNPRYFGLFNPAPVLPAVIAEGLAAVYNPQMAAWSHAPVANEIEQHTLRFIATKLSLPTEQLACTFTSGGSEANHSAVLVALAHHFPQSLDDGIGSLPKRPCLYVSAMAHNSFDKIAKHVGLGLNALRVVPVNDELQLDMIALKTMLTEDRAAGWVPFMVVGTAGATATGVIDPLPELAQLCQEQSLWFHVDAAWAGAVAISPKLKPILAGIEQADSVTVDAHKWFNLTMGAGMFFTRHAKANQQAFAVRADYMPPSENNVVVPYLTTLQWSRRFIGLKLFMALAEFGESGYAAMIEAQTDLAHYFREQLHQQDWQVVNKTALPVVNFTHSKLTTGNLTADDLLQQLYAQSDTWISTVTINGQKVFRFCVTNFKSTRQDVDYLLGELTRLLY